MFNISEHGWQLGFQLHLDTGTLKPTFFNPYGKDRSRSWIFKLKNFVFKQKIEKKIGISTPSPEPGLAEPG